MSAVALHNLRPAGGSRHRRKRVGRGNASGKGTYAGRGMKGQKSRTGVGGLKRLGMRHILLSIPKKRGFLSSKPKQFGINVGEIDKKAVANDNITADWIVKHGLARANRQSFKILGDGEVTKPIQIHNLPVSAKAKEKIIAAGGSVLAVRS